jgi:hypothetical protein
MGQEYALEWSIPVRDIWLNETKHLPSHLYNLDEGTIVDLEKTKQLKDFAGFGRDFIDTTI